MLTHDCGYIGVGTGIATRIDTRIVVYIAANIE